MDIQVILIDYQNVSVKLTFSNAFKSGNFFHDNDNVRELFQLSVNLTKRGIMFCIT